jgi:hypothetical protein
MVVLKRLRYLWSSIYHLVPKLKVRKPVGESFHFYDQVKYSSNPQIKDYHWFSVVHGPFFH